MNVNPEISDGCRQTPLCHILMRLTKLDINLLLLCHKKAEPFLSLCDAICKWLIKLKLSYSFSNGSKRDFLELWK